MVGDRPLPRLSEPNAEVGGEPCRATLRVTQERPDVGTRGESGEERAFIIRWVGWCRPAGETHHLDRAASSNDELQYEGPLEKSDGSVTEVLTWVRILGKHGRDYRMKGVRPPEEIEE